MMGVWTYGSDHANWKCLEKASPILNVYGHSLLVMVSQQHSWRCHPSTASTLYRKLAQWTRDI